MLIFFTYLQPNSFLTQIFDYIFKNKKNRLLKSVTWKQTYTKPIKAWYKDIISFILLITIYQIPQKEICYQGRHSVCKYRVANIIISYK